MCATGFDLKCFVRFIKSNTFQNEVQQVESCGGSAAVLGWGFGISGWIHKERKSLDWGQDCCYWWTCRGCSLWMSFMKVEFARCFDLKETGEIKYFLYAWVILDLCSKNIAVVL